ncbi:MAG TPA: hypothetical protein PLU53_06680 [Bacteroidia bacterium]|nr:hypothetical protein [Bacteroidia bacterium]
MKNNLHIAKSFKTVLAAACILFLQAVPTTVFGNEPAFDKGSKTIGLSVGFGVSYSYYGSYSSSPALALTYDHGIVGEVGPGTIGIGGIVGYKSASYKYGYGDYKATWTNIIVGVRGTYHLTILKDKNNKFDPYAGVTVGLRFNSYKDTYYDYYYATYGYHYSSYNYSSTSIVSGLFIGAKYNFSPNIGAFAEVGYDISLARIGINFNF